MFNLRSRRIQTESLGRIDVITSSQGLCALAFIDHGDVNRTALEMIPEAPGDEQLHAIERQVLRLANGQAMDALLPIDLSALSDFTGRVLQATARIPRGHTASYGDIARQIGSPAAARAVGQALGRNPVPLIVPCHRVLGAQNIGGFTPGLALKRVLLDLEKMVQPQLN